MISTDSAGLLDTSVVIDLMVSDPEDLPRDPFISSVTLAELGVGPLVAHSSQERQQRQHVLQLAESSFDALPFDATCARHFASVAGALRRNGRKRTARAFDALIAATALAHHIPLYTKNPRDFVGVPDLDVRAVPRPNR